MIVDLVLSALFGGLAAVLNLMPSWTIPTPDTTSVGTFIGRSLLTINGVFPAYTLATCLGIVLALQLLLQGHDFVVWVYHQFWGSD